MITVVDMGIGNLGAFLAMLQRLSIPAQVNGDPKAIRSARRLILPGVGHFDHAMRNLRGGLEPVLRHKAHVERAAPHPESGPPDENLRRLPPGTEFGGDGPPLGSVLARLQDRLDGPPQVRGRHLRVRAAGLD